MLRSDMAGLGLGPLLMRRIIDYSRAKGLKELVGDVLRENRPMLRLCDLFHFEQTPMIDEPALSRSSCGCECAMPATGKVTRLCISTIR